MRLFAAVLPPPEAVTELTAAVDPLRALPGAERLRWTAREGWHFTLAFYGEVNEAALPELHVRLARAAHRHPPFDLRIVGGGRFADRVVWAGADGGTRAMRRLADSAGAAARRAGVPMDEHRAYHPHLTIARSRGKEECDITPYVEGLDGFTGGVWTAGRLDLVRSRLPVDGVPHELPRYESVAAWPLGG